MPMRPEATEALAVLIHEYGNSIINMPSSCQMYLSLKLAGYPEEKELFADALRRGIPEQIQQHAGSDDFATKLTATSVEFARVQGIDPELAAEVVTAWAEALDFPIGHRKGVIPDRDYGIRRHPTYGRNERSEKS